MIAARRLTGVILLGGWLLLVPSDGVPMREWEQVTAYDTAQACEDGKAQQIADYERHVVALMTGEGPRKIWEEMNQWRCLPTEVVYSPTPAATPAAKWWWPW